MENQRKLKHLLWIILGVGLCTNIFGLETGLSVYDGKQTEKNSIEFVVSMSAKPAIPIEFLYSTTDGTAKAGHDYIKTSGKLTIPAGEKKAIINVPLIRNPKNINNSPTLYLTISSKTAVFIPKAAGMIIPNKIYPDQKESNISKGGSK